MIKNNETTFIKSEELKKENTLSVEVKSGELVWLFSYESQSLITIEVNAKKVEEKTVSPMTLFVFSLEEEEESQKITISSDVSIPVFMIK